MKTKYRYALVGTGDRAGAFLQSIGQDFRQHAELVALCDSCQSRLDFRRNLYRKEFGSPEIPGYNPDQFVRMIEDVRPDRIIVTSIDATHHHYIIAGIQAGCDIITEKPMTIDAEKCRAILEANWKQPGKIRVAFNYRWGPGPTRLKELLMEHVIGRIHSIQFDYLLNTAHGADYFRRWHSDKDQSGGLLVHKATHHFDLVNWWLDEIPGEVIAWGRLAFYGKKNALIRGDASFTAYPRYTGYETGNDPFAFKLDNEMLRGLYLQAEPESGYIRDQNVFRQNISIEDIMSLLVRYRNQVVLNYSLNCFGPYEGYRATLNGDKGRIEYFTRSSGFAMDGLSGKENLRQPGADSSITELRVLPLYEPEYMVEIPELPGGHGGADPLLHRQIFDQTAPPDPLNRSAGAEQGAAACLIGIAGNLSMNKNGCVISLNDLAPLPTGKVRLHELS